MKKRIQAAVAVAAALIAGMSVGTAEAADGYWTNNNNGTWSDTANWQGGIVANGADFTAYFMIDITAARTVTLDTARSIGNVKFADTPTASSDLTISGANILTLDVTSGSPVINVSNQTLTIACAIAGSDGLTKAGGGVLTLSGANTALTGPITICDGILKAGNISCLGPNGSPTTVTNGGTYDINGIKLNDRGEQFCIAGMGYNGTGAVINSGAQQMSAMSNLFLLDDAAIGSWGNRWDVRGTGGAGTLDMGGKSLTKVGGGRVYLVDLNVTNANQFIIKEGYLAATRCQTDGAGTVLVLNGGQFGFDNYAVGAWDLPITLSNGVLKQTGTTALTTHGALIFLLDTNTVDVITNTTLVLTNTIAGEGSWTKQGAGTLKLTGNSTYAGGTMLSDGTLIANGAGALGSGAVTVTVGMLVIDAADAMDDTAALYLPSATTTNLTMNTNDTVGSLYVGGVQQPPDVYTSSGAGSGWMAGSGSLTVLPEPAAMACVLGACLLAGRRRRNR